MTFTAATTALLLSREQGRCFWCRDWVASGIRGLDYSAHHRCPKGMGGTKAAWVNAASNGLILCGTGTEGCHGYFEGNRSTAYDLGILLSGIAASTRPDRRPLHMPVTDRDGRTWLLTDDGRKEPAPTTP